VARFLLLQDGHGHFGQVVHHQVIDGPARHLAVRRLEPVAPEALAGGDPHGARAPRRRHGSGSRRTASTPMPSDGWMRTSMSGVNPSGRVSAGGRGSGTTERPPATTCTSVPPPTARGCASRKRTRTVTLSAGAPRPLTATERSAPRSVAVARPPATSAAVDASMPVAATATAQGASAARTVAVTPESGGATTSSSYTPGTRSSASTTNRVVPGRVPPSETTESWPVPRNGAPFGSNR